MNLGITNREVAKLVRDAVRSGRWSAAKTNGGHIRLTHSSGAVYFTAATPGDRRAHLNLRADLRKIEQRSTIIPPKEARNV